MKHILKAGGVCLTVALLTACGGSGGGGGGSTSSGGSTAAYVDGGTFTVAMSADPGNLDPQMSASSDLLQLTAFSYDSLVSTTTDGTIVSNLAKDWKVDGSTVTMTLNDGITCSDGTPFTAEDAAANISFMGDPANKSAFTGVFVPAGAKATASGSTLTISLASPAPFVLEGLSAAPMVCKSGLDDRASLAKASAGTGPYQLSEVVPSDHFTFTKRDGYTWGPDGATTAEKGIPAKVTVKIVANQTTAANLLLSGGLNAATDHRAGRRPARGGQAVLRQDRLADRGDVVQPRRRPPRRRHRRPAGHRPGHRLRAGAGRPHRQAGQRADDLRGLPAGGVPRRLGHGRHPHRRPRTPRRPPWTRPAGPRAPTAPAPRAASPWRSPSSTSRSPGPRAPRRPSSRAGSGSSWASSSR